MRKLKTPDIFSTARAIKRLGLREQVLKLALECDTADDLWNRGFDLFWWLVDSATEDGEKEFYKILSGPFEMSAEDVENLDLTDMMPMLGKLIDENDLKTFWNAVAGILKKLRS